MNSLSEDEARNDFETNFWGKFNVCKKGAKHINTGGSITLISGAFAKKPNPDVFMTTISVSAIETMAKTLALSLSPIRVNVISHYVVDTSLVDPPKDIDDAAIFLLSNPYMTGSLLSIDGGFTII